MKTCKRCGRDKPPAAFSPRADAKDGLAYWCTPCKTEATKAGPRRKQVVQGYRMRNIDACAVRVAASVAKDPARYAAKARESAARRHRENPEHVRALKRRTYANNREAEIARVRRRQGRIRAVMPWVTQAHSAEMQGVYRFCSLFPAFEVDHIVPLNGKQVSGLHVPENLQALTVRANRQKGATYEVQ
jgi:5-methylcytosine-specific restriction endonuclease McrA